VFASATTPAARKQPARNNGVATDSDSSPAKAAVDGFDDSDDEMFGSRLWKSNADDELEIAAVEVKKPAAAGKKRSAAGATAVTPSNRAVKKESAKKKRAKKQSTLSDTFQISGNASLDQARLYFERLDRTEKLSVA
jgi:hypothetical protein